MRTVKVLTGAEAAMLVKDGDTITTSGFVACGLPETLSKALTFMQQVRETEMAAVLTTSHMKE